MFLIQIVIADFYECPHKGHPNAGFYFIRFFFIKRILHLNFEGVFVLKWNMDMEAIVEHNIRQCPPRLCWQTLYEIFDQILAYSHQ